MSDSPNVPRRYDDDEVAEILKRATELHREDTGRHGRGGGLTLMELEEIAKEAGIDPLHLRRAALELDRPGAPAASRWRWLVGDDTTLVYEHVVPGEIPDRSFEELVAIIQESSFDYGQPSLLGRTLTWRAETPTKTRSVQVVVSCRGGETHIRVEERLQQLAGSLFGGITAGVGLPVGVGVGVPVGVVTLGSALFAVAFPLGMLGLAYLGAREAYHIAVARRRSVLRDLADRLTEQVTASVRPEAEVEDPASS